MKLTCIHCGKLFEGDNAKFYFQGCRDSYIDVIDKRIGDAVKNDPSHTSHLSND